MPTKFHARRKVQKAEVEVETGFRSGAATTGVKFRIRLPGQSPFTIDYATANALADCLDEAIDQQDEEPLL